MKINLVQDLTKKELELLIKYQTKNQELTSLLSHLQDFEKKIPCFLKDHKVFISITDIFYIESVDKKTFIYSKNEVYRSDSRLYQHLDDLSSFGFIQINKSCILNIKKLVSILPLKNSRMEAVLNNDEHLYITRKYLSSIKNKLQEEHA